MYFRVRYIVRDFEFGDAQISLSDPERRLDVIISKRPGDANYPPLAANQGVATAECQKEIPARLRDEAISSGNLSVKREVVGEVYRELSMIVLRTLRLARWRANCTKSGPNPIQSAIEFSWSVDGTEWKRVADNLRFQLEFSVLPRWTNEAEEFVRAGVLGDLDEPLAHELLREAATNRKENPRSSLVLAVVAAEVGFKQFASKSFPDADWILEKLPSPPLDKMLQAFPWSKLDVHINDKVPRIPDSIQNELKKAVLLRNQIVHSGVHTKLKVETVDSVLIAVRDLLYFLDALRGHTWAANHMSADALKSLS